MNMCIMTGRLTRDPELKTVGQNGTTLANFTIAVNGYNKDQPASFFECVAWGKTAELLDKYFKKGDLLQFSASAQQQTWQAKDGQKKSKVIFNVRALDFLPRAKPATQNKPDDFINNDSPVEEEIPF